MEKLKKYKKETDDTEDKVPDIVISSPMVDDVATGLLVQEEKSLKISTSTSDENIKATNDKETEFYRLTDVSFSAPGSDSNLVVDLSISQTKDTNLLIMGPSGCGKSSLLRVLKEDCGITLVSSGVNQTSRPASCLRHLSLPIHA